MSTNPTESELADELRIAADSPEALTAFFARTAQAADDPPEHRAWVRGVAEGLRRGGHPERGANVMVAALEDLKRLFTVEDTDDDGGWHRGEAKRWQLWANLRTLERSLSALDAESRQRVDSSVQDLCDPSLEEWFSPSDLEALTPPPESDSMVTPDSPEALRAVLGAQAKSLNSEEVAMNRALNLSRACEHPEASDLAVAAQLGLLALALDEDASASEVLTASPERELVSAELLAPIQALLGPAVERGPYKLRDQIWRAALAHSPALLARLQPLVGPDTATAAEQLALLRERRAALSTTRQRLDIDSELVHNFGAHLDDEEFLALCAEHRWTRPGMRRLLQTKRVEEAIALAREAEAYQSDQGQSFHELPELVTELIEFGCVENATELLEPHKSQDATHGELYARCLLLQERPEATAAHVAWFKQRPTVQTYSAIAAALSEPAFHTARGEMNTHLETRNLLTTALDIAVHEVDLEAIERIVLKLDPDDLEHARLRATQLLPKLGKKARARLTPPSAAATPATPIPVEVPTRVTHKKFGAGEVLQVEGTGEQTKFVIDFEEHGTKVLLARFVQPVE